jgi:hypothetical protein
LNEVRRIPFKDELVDDAVYNELMAAGDAAVPCLIEKITDVGRMHDPRTAPVAADFRVGDLAFILLSRITKVPIEEMLPAEVTREFSERGIYAYFAYVQKSEHRQLIQKRWRVKWGELRGISSQTPQARR